MVNNVTADSLEKKFKGEGVSRFTQIAHLGGFGLVSDAGGHIPPAFEGGLDIGGVLAEENTAVSIADKAKIRELAGIDAPAEPTKSVSKGEK